ncbi:MAG: hypothetical protein M1833_000060 [Piccolia ochrophora]|nr:MAG: hypothetical protein M1833_000060 [Piccolia ochrophora]
MANAAMNIAETIQTASINRAPSPHHDLNPSTAASKKQPVTISEHGSSENDDEDEISSAILRPQPRKSTLPPLPDLRFEQSYLASISQAETRGRVAWITIRDQVFLPLLQGTLWTLAVQGWRYWNKSASFSGATVGSRVRKWWYGVNHWTIPNGRLQDQKLASDVADYYKEQFSSATGD